MTECPFCGEEHDLTYQRGINRYIDHLEGHADDDGGGRRCPECGSVYTSDTDRFHMCWDCGHKWGTAQ